MLLSQRNKRSKMADNVAQSLGRKDSGSPADENVEEKPAELPQEAEFVSDSGGYNDEEGGREDMAHMPEGEVIEGDETGGDEDDNENDNDCQRHDDDDMEDAKACGSDYVEEGEEREEGDGEEGYGDESNHVAVTAKDKVLDFDEDRRNPQYIPKKGGFYEHDDRLGEEEAAPAEATTVEDEKNKAAKKKLWKAEGKWEHDYFQDDEQNPKSRDELIATYGYDIRNEDGPPRARRRRRYGRGPMKYTRNWEDENAYGKPGLQRSGDVDDERESFRGGYRGRRSGRGSGFRGGGRSSRGGSGRGGGRGWNGRDDENQENNRSADSTYQGDEANDNKDKSLDEGYEGYAPAKSAEYPTLPVRIESTSQESKANNADRGRKSSRRNFVKSPRSRGGLPKNGPPPIVNETELLSGFKKLNVSSDTYGHQVSGAPTGERRKEAKIAPTQHNTSGMPHERRQATVPPRLQDSASNRPKRYSSQRQRQGGDPVQPEYQQSSGRLHDNEPSSMPPRFYEPSYQHAVYTDPPAAPNNVQHGSPGTPAATLMPQHYQGYDAPYQDTYAIRPMANSPSRGIFNPVTLAAAAAANGQQQQPPPSVIPAPYIPATGGNILSYGPPPPPAYPPPQYHHHHQQQYAVSQYVSPAPPPPVSQPQEIFRCGMAYYNAPPPVRTLPKRPRAAIPIVPPPELEDQRKDDLQEYTVTSEHLMHSSEQTVNVDN